MAHIRIPHEAWVLVADGGKAVIYRNQGDEAMIDLRTVETREHKAAPARDLGTDRPGRGFGTDGRRAAMAQTDFHDEEETRFVLDVAADLAAALGRGEFARLVLIAPPKVLGRLRTALTPQLADAVIGEIVKDLAHREVEVVEQHLRAAA
ncbi:host attachment protein [Oharaeibacter diazotrophicus]|uniref:Protein required for attachment to host cells n=1 Tax=Oharaeibacter diazotrophicus TaxID=1920512 RepID=A0A4R6RDW9_9HYPH|nr:host attachment family protein [Oharaeibacter diazotrophicus]TDP84265.1 protein required for attachment to host cells [Oharaeibacter diazotrophicus]BBE73302.1 protein required for attachment to host cells [Pleomorphomonas sp. SM30]GLS75093.1 host attachment protein [Oharaeibacter diazotrophicus]